MKIRTTMKYYYIYEEGKKGISSKKTIFPD